MKSTILKGQATFLVTTRSVVTPPGRSASCAVDAERPKNVTTQSVVTRGVVTRGSYMGGISTTRGACPVISKKRVSAE